MRRMLRICGKPGCNTLSEGRYCDKHAAGAAADQRSQQRQAFDALESHKTDAERRFYASRAWSDARARHRANEPLCRRCRSAGLVVAGALVHHSPPLAVLLSQGHSGLESEHLETLCSSCHLAELRQKRPGGGG
jgi:5-methylcytosine-specific restriction protein A